MDHTRRLSSIRFAPLAAPVLAERRLCATLTVAALLQVGLTAAGLTGWPCPVRAFSNMTCPGCGLSRALTALMEGRWLFAFHMHPFAFAAAPALAAAAVLTVLPDRQRTAAVSGLAAFERRTGIFIFLVLGLVLHWIIRTA